MRARHVAQTFLSAGSGDFPVARIIHEPNTELESSVNPQAGKPALRNFSNYGFTRFDSAVAHAPEPHGTRGRLVRDSRDSAAAVWFWLLHLQSRRDERLVPAKNSLSDFHRQWCRSQGR